MKKVSIAISLLLCAVFLLTTAMSIPFSASEKAKAPEMGSIEEIIASYYDTDGRPMSCAHRAISYIGNPIPENSLLAIQDCIDHKVDIVELDIMRTSDGVFVLCHDSSIKRTTTYTGSKSVSSMTYAEICQYPLLKYTGGSQGVYYDENGKTLVMPTFEEALKLCKDNIMINLDKFTGQWNYRMELYELVRKNGCLDNVMFKGGYDSAKIQGWHKEIKAKYGNDAKMPNFCTLNSNRDAATYINYMKSHAEAKTAFAVESGFNAYGQPQSDPAVLKQIRKYTRTFVNVLTESLGSSGYCAGHKENSTGWAEMVALGYNIMQTNNAADCAAWIYANYSTPTRDIANGLDLMYFNNYRHNETSYTVQVQAPSVKLLNGDYISFKNVDFSNSVGKSMIVNITSHSKTGELVIRKDSASGEIIAKFDLSKLASQNLSAIEQLSDKNYGVCDIYVCAENMGTGSVSASKLTCTDPKEGKVAHINGLSVFTRPGKEPVLPSEVTVVTEFGMTYSSDVVWAPIPKACYSENLTFFKVPGILKSNCQTVYASVTVIDLDMTGAAIWFDSKVDVETNSAGEVLTWYDRINSTPATATANKAPTYKSGVLSFDGLNDSMVYNHSLSDKGNVSIILNAQTNKKTTDYLSNYVINNTARYTLLHYPESGSWGSVWVSGFKNGIVCRFGSGGDNNRGIYYTGTTLSGWSTVSAVKNGTSEKLYLNSSMVYDRAADTSARYQMGTPGATIKATHEYAYIGLGIQGSANYYYNGEVGDIVVFERTLSANEIATLSEYFNAKNLGTLKDKSSTAASGFDSFVKNNLDKVHSLVHTSLGASTHKVTCENCSYSATASHSFKYTDKNDDKHTKSCNYCSYSTEENHSYKQVSHTDPTDDKDGTTVYKCSACNGEKTVTEGKNAYTVTLVNATSQKTSYYKGDTVTVTADKAPEGKEFAGWKVSDGVTLSDPFSETTTFTMIGADVSVEALYAAKRTPIGNVTVTVSGYEFMKEAPKATITASAAGTVLESAQWFTVNNNIFASFNGSFKDTETYAFVLTFEVDEAYTGEDLTNAMINITGASVKEISIDYYVLLRITVIMDPLAHTHTFDQQNTEVQGALKSAADCENKAVYYKSCVCGAVSATDTFESGEALGHTYTDDCDESCDREGCNNTRVAPHTPKAPTANGDKHEIRCEKCEKVLESKDHSYENGKCKDCGVSEPAKNTEKPKKNGGCSGYVGSMAIPAVIALAATMVLKKKKEE